MAEHFGGTVPEPLLVRGLASRSVDRPTFKNSVIIDANDVVYWQGEIVGQVKAVSLMRRVGTLYRMCTLLVDGRPEGFGCQNPAEDTFVFLGVPLVLPSLNTEATYDPVARSLVITRR